MDNRDWIVLKILFEEKNITKTAKRLYISQPALTSRIQQIEKEFGVKIAIRGRRGINFTPQGEHLAKYANEMLFRIEKLKEDILNMNNDVVGTLKLAVSKYFTKYKLPALIKTFKEKYPNVEFKIVTDWSSNVFNLIYNQDVHIGIVRGDYNWSDKKHLLFEESICMASMHNIDIATLPNSSRIDYHTDYFLKSLIDNWWAENYSCPPTVSIEVDQVDTCKEMVVHGLGYGIMPGLILEGIEGLKTINIMDKSGNPILRKTWMLYHEEFLKINIVNAFVDFVEKFYSF